MINITELEEIEELLDYKFPKSIRKLVENNLVNFDDWFFMYKDQFITINEGIKKRYKSRDLIAFAKCSYSDDTACFDRNIPDKVFIIHDFASEGFESREIYDNFGAWFISVMNEFINSCEQGDDD